MKLLELIVFFLVAFLFIFIIDFFFICKKKKKSYRITGEGLYLIKRFNLNESKIDIKLLDFHISIINAFIISFVSVTISLINTNIVFELAIGFVLLLLLIYAMYEIYGRIIVKKWGKENGI